MLAVHGRTRMRTPWHAMHGMGRVTPPRGHVLSCTSLPALTMMTLTAHTRAQPPPLISPLLAPPSPPHPTRSAASVQKMDAYAVLKYPLTTESAMKKIEDNNTLVSSGSVKEPAYKDFNNYGQMSKALP
jgi:hypothetical protein